MIDNNWNSEGDRRPLTLLKDELFPNMNRTFFQIENNSDNLSQRTVFFIEFRCQAIIETILSPKLYLLRSIIYLNPVNYLCLHAPK